MTDQSPDIIESMKALQNVKAMAEAECQASKQHWNIGDVHDADLKKVLAARPLPASRDTSDITEIVNDVCAQTGITFADILGQERSRRFSTPRYFAMWKAKRMGYTYRELGEYFGRNPTGISRGVRLIDSLLSSPL